MITRQKYYWLLLAIALGVGFGYEWHQHAIRSAPSVIAPPTEVSIQDRKTIDFSSGQPVVKDSTQEKALIDSAAKEMDEAAKNIRFAPTAAPVDHTTVEPVKTPPKS